MSTAVQRRFQRRQRDRVMLARLIGTLGRAPTVPECAASGVYFGVFAPFRTLREALAPFGLEPQRCRRRPRTQSARRRCEACAQLTDWSPTCQHCHHPWTRTRSAA